MDREWAQLLNTLHDRVLTAMREEGIEDESQVARLAADYESYCRMGHAPARARRLAEQLLFQQRAYADEENVEELALQVTATLARIYRNWQETC